MPVPHGFVLTVNPGLVLVVNVKVCAVEATGISIVTASSHVRSLFIALSF